MKLTKTRLKQIIREELNEEFRIGYMGPNRTTQIDRDDVRKWTKKGYDFDSGYQGLDTVAIVKEPSGEILRVFHDVPREIFDRLVTSDDPDVKKVMGLKRGMKAYEVRGAKGYANNPNDAAELEKEAEDLFSSRKSWGDGRKFRIPTYEYIEKHYPDMPFFDFNDYMAPQGPRSGKRPGKSVIGDLEDGE